MCHVMNVSSRGLRAFRNRPASHRQRSDLVTLAHIKEQSRLSLGSYGRPRMTEELKEIGLKVGPPLPDKRLQSNLPRGHHTDRGSQYCSHDYQKILRQHGFRVSPLMVCKQTTAGQRMSGKGNFYPSRDLLRKPCWAVDNAAVETFFKSSTLGTLLRNTLPCNARLNSSGDILGKAAGRLRWPSLNTSTASTIHVAATQHWAGKARSLLNEGWLKRVLGAALKRDRSSLEQLSSVPQMLFISVFSVFAIRLAVLVLGQTSRVI